MRRLVVSLVAGVTLLVVGAAGGGALAAAKLHVLSKACVATASRAITAPVKGKCPKGSLLEQLGSSTPGRTGATGARGATGATGPQGPPGQQGPPGTPAAAKSFVVNYKQGSGLVNASPGVTLTGGPTDSSVSHDESTRWSFPVDISACATEVTVGYSFFTYAVGSSGPLAQVARTTDGRQLYVLTTWGGGTGTDFSLLVTCP